MSTSSTTAKMTYRFLGNSGLIVSKFGLGSWMPYYEKYTDSGLNIGRKHIVEGTNAALGHLQLGYVDVIYYHRPEPYTPIEEAVRAMNFRAVPFTGWGTSEWFAADIREACKIADRLGLIRPIAE
ncbi:hypothetical protein F442_21969 [Phytophthora nicotianae P10297]|uniref:NADP-dependent oxidoreductase domain-containing protein n=2 Tax=Phytophthora nicotianae TaxID=4792 RepID=W2Y247_PHYNI|nr:hypothetical protein L916_21373 [Phytophthora nicotianae]ETP28797.1 hypothetical protein F442_21969 [Phytophthora nicotianae P10297]